MNSLFCFLSSAIDNYKIKKNLKKLKKNTRDEQYWPLIEKKFSNAKKDAILGNFQKINLLALLPNIISKEIEDIALKQHGNVIETFFMWSNLKYINESQIRTWCLEKNENISNWALNSIIKGILTFKNTEDIILHENFQDKIQLISDILINGCVWRRWNCLSKDIYSIIHVFISTDKKKLELFFNQISKKCDLSIPRAIKYSTNPPRNNLWEKWDETESISQWLVIKTFDQFQDFTLEKEFNLKIIDFLNFLIEKNYITEDLFCQTLINYYQKIDARFKQIYFNNFQFILNKTKINDKSYSLFHNTDFNYLYEQKLFNQIIKKQINNINKENKKL